ncbi:Glycine--tRNA ligase alpha subunit [bacterium AB1]|nr:Glycine--tRNA ligase alpha subunit [bacterium AB1]
MDILNFIQYLNHIFERYKYKILKQKTLLPIGAATFDLNTFDYVDYIFQNEQDNDYKVSFPCLCYRPDDYIDHKLKIRNYKYFQYQALFVLKEGQNIINIVIDLVKSIFKEKYNIIKYYITFLEDNWRSPCMGAYGYGYEMKIFGLEVLQITNMHQFVNKKIQHLNIWELAFGVERLLLFYNDYNNNFGLDFSHYLYSNKIIDDLYNLYNNKQTSNLLLLLSKYIQIINIKYNDFVILNLVFNILDSRNEFCSTEKNLLMQKIYQTIK